ncbi:MAG: rRNA pseudouridine synthase [Pirellulales bacterium]|nr:rRNA pseudouridine synthase [Pirellulales bacterium]
MPHPKNRKNRRRSPSAPVPKPQGKRPFRASRKPEGAGQGRAEDSSPCAGDRLQKVLALAGIASRRECESLIREGRVEVDRHVVTELGTRVDPIGQEIRIDGEPLPRPKLAYFAVNKPVGVVCTARDPAGRPRVIDLLPHNAPRVFCVGRLDMTSEGLILVTNDGALANGLTHPRHGVEKIYHVQVAGQVEHDVLAQLHKGIHLAEGFAQVKRARIKSRRKRSSVLEMILDEGRNREIRRLLARVGHKVQRLKRIAVGPVRLGELPTGAVRPLTNKEIEALQKAITRGPREERDSQKTSKPQPSAQGTGSSRQTGHSKKAKPSGRDGKPGRVVIR